jgi:hypothetical protein
LQEEKKYSDQVTKYIEKEEEIQKEKERHEANAVKYMQEMKDLERTKESFVKEQDEKKKHFSNLKKEIDIFEKNIAEFGIQKSDMDKEKKKMVIELKDQEKYLNQNRKKYQAMIKDYDFLEDIEDIANCDQDKDRKISIQSTPQRTPVSTRGSLTPNIENSAKRKKHDLEEVEYCISIYYEVIFYFC